MAGEFIHQKHMTHQILVERKKNILRNCLHFINMNIKSHKIDRNCRQNQRIQINKRFFSSRQIGIIFVAPHQLSSVVLLHYSACLSTPLACVEHFSQRTTFASRSADTNVMSLRFRNSKATHNSRCVMKRRLI